MIVSKYFDLKEKKDLINIFFIIIFACSFILSFVIFLTLSGNLSNLEEVENVSKLISINFVLIITLILISIKKIKENFDKEKFKSKFKIQFTLLFIFIKKFETILSLKS